MIQKIRAYILELNENGDLTGRHLWDENCELLEILANGNALRVNSSYCLLPEIAVRIPDEMNWGVVDGMRFNFRTWDAPDHIILLNY